MKIFIILTLLILYLNYSYGYFNYQLYSNDCKKPQKGVSFGMNEMTCVLNATTSSLFTFQIYQTNQVNLTTHSTIYCDNPHYSKLLTINKCQKYGLVNYKLTKTKTVPKIPKGSYLIQEFDGNCENVDSYWYANNATTVVDFKNSNLQTTYLCLNGIPYSKVCNNGQCTFTNDQKSCDSDNQTQISCSN